MTALVLFITYMFTISITGYIWRTLMNHGDWDTNWYQPDPAHFLWPGICSAGCYNTCPLGKIYCTDFTQMYIEWNSYEISTAQYKNLELSYNARVSEGSGQARGQVFIEYAFYKASNTDAYRTLRVFGSGDIGINGNFIFNAWNPSAEFQDAEGLIFKMRTTDDIGYLRCYFNDFYLTGDFFTTIKPSAAPSVSTSVPSQSPTLVPSQSTLFPSRAPTLAPIKSPTLLPTRAPSLRPTLPPTQPPTLLPTRTPSVRPTLPPTQSPTLLPTQPPTLLPTRAPSLHPTLPPTQSTLLPTQSPSFATRYPTVSTINASYSNYTVSISFNCEQEAVVRACDINKTTITRQVSAIIVAYIDPYYNTALLSTDIINDEVVIILSIQTDEYNSLIGEAIGDRIEK
eukprot:463719_1